MKWKQNSRTDRRTDANVCSPFLWAVEQCLVWMTIVFDAVSRVISTNGFRAGILTHRNERTKFKINSKKETNKKLCWCWIRFEYNNLCVVFISAKPRSFPFAWPPQTFPFCSPSRRRLARAEHPSLCNPIDSNFVIVLPVCVVRFESIETIWFLHLSFLPLSGDRISSEFDGCASFLPDANRFGWPYIIRGAFVGGSSRTVHFTYFCLSVQPILVLLDVHLPDDGARVLQMFAK